MMIKFKKIRGFQKCSRLCLTHFNTISWVNYNQFNNLNVDHFANVRTQTNHFKTCVGAFPNVESKTHLFEHSPLVPTKRCNPIVAVVQVLLLVRTGSSSLNRASFL